MINYGVIVGRFQVNSLHAGHLELFRQVSEKHDRVIVFIGVPRTIPTKRNPLDFETRKKMIQADYPDFTILPLRDEKTDKFWSEKLDDAIASVTTLARVSLYGGRDSFVPHYFGIHKVEQLEIPSPTSGTEIRERVSARIMQSPDFRAGVIYAAGNRFPTAIPTVDIAILHNDGIGRIRVLLGKKSGEQYYRFIGGFVEPRQTLEDNARREAYEETKLDVSSLEYVGSFPVDDWRYAQDKDAKIITTFFVGWSMTKTGTAGDDIKEIRWFDVVPYRSANDTLAEKYEPLPPVIEAAHMPLLDAFKAYIDRRYHATQPTTTN
jgi:bifunctional NMN adenylyltransferase/nudix hydrolase